MMEMISVRLKVCKKMRIICQSATLKFSNILKHSSLKDNPTCPTPTSERPQPLP
jgi:hypothetical protein